MSKSVYSVNYSDQVLWWGGGAEGTVYLLEPYFNDTMPYSIYQVFPQQASQVLWIKYQPGNVYIFSRFFYIKISVISNGVSDDRECGRETPPSSSTPHRRRCPSFCVPSRQSQIPSPSFSGRCPWCHRRWSQSVLWRRTSGTQKSREGTEWELRQDWESSLPKHKKKFYAPNQVSKVQAELHNYQNLKFNSQFFQFGWFWKKEKKYWFFSTVKILRSISLSLTHSAGESVVDPGSC